MEKVYPDHTQDLQTAIYHLPPNFDLETLCKCLKQVYDTEGFLIAQQWILKAKNTAPKDFQAYWDNLRLTKYYEENFDKYISEKIYQVAKKTNWVPKSFQHGEKKSPSMKLLKDLAIQTEYNKESAVTLKMAHEHHLPEEEKSYLAKGVINFEGACYVHPAMSKKELSSITKNDVHRLTKIIDCEVRVLEAVEHLGANIGRYEDELEVKYMIEFDNKVGKNATGEASHEELTTRTRFSAFLVSKGFIKFIGGNIEFDLFHEFLINGQTYPTVRESSWWGEYKPGKFLFKNGLYDTENSKFIKSDEKDRIPYQSKYLTCPTGREQISPPILSVPKPDSKEILAQIIKQWELLNGDINVRTTLGYAVACIFSSTIMKELKSFPILFKFGVRGTGKSSSMDWFMALFGYKTGNRQSISKQNTIKGVIRSMTLSRGFPFFLDDFRSHETNSQVPDLTTSILNWYNWIGSAMAKRSMDNQTIDTPMKACVVMTGNDKPTDAAALSRMIILNYNKFIKKEELSSLTQITSNLDRFSEFTGLILSDYKQVKERYFEYVEENSEYLINQNFEGRTVNNWSVILSGIQCVSDVFPGLHLWKSEFEGFRIKICEKINKEAQVEVEHNPIHVFFGELEYYATQKMDKDSDYNNKRLVLDDRHFKYKDWDTVTYENDKNTYTGPILALHIKRIWQALPQNRAEINNNNSLKVLEHHLQNSSYFITKGKQIMLTKSIVDQEEANLRCYMLDATELQKNEMLLEVIEKAKGHELERKKRL